MLGSTMGTAIKEISEIRCSGDDGEESNQIIYWQWMWLEAWPTAA